MNSGIVWRGLSELDGVTPIVLILTGFDERSGNSKTGAMVQSYILVDDLHPADAIKSGRDSAICGKCPHRGNHGQGRTCYVALHTGLHVVGRKLRDHKYPELKITKARMALADRRLRMGTYGDPAAVPFEVWAQLLSYTSGHTGYTHQWRSCDPRFRDVVMASVDDPLEREWARSEGWRTFRVRRVTDSVEPLRRGEIVCPASIEGHKKTTCERCKLCSGARLKARDIAIIDHSTSALWKRGLGPRKLSVVTGV